MDMDIDTEMKMEMFVYICVECDVAPMVGKERETEESEEGISLLCRI